MSPTDIDLDLLQKAMTGGVTDDTDAKTWTYSPRIVTHRAYHDRQAWREHLARWLYHLGNRIDRIADRVDPWHEDDEWYTREADPPIHFTFTVPIHTEPPAS